MDQGWMKSLAALAEMGGYGAFVWSAFGITALVLAILLMVSVRSLRTNEAALAALQAGTERNASAGDAELAKGTLARRSAPSLSLGAGEGWSEDRNAARERPK